MGQHDLNSMRERARSPSLTRSAPEELYLAPFADLVEVGVGFFVADSRLGLARGGDMERLRLRRRLRDAPSEEEDDDDESSEQDDAATALPRDREIHALLFVFRAQRFFSARRRVSSSFAAITGTGAASVSSLRAEQRDLMGEPFPTRLS